MFLSCKLTLSPLTQESKLVTLLYENKMWKFPMEHPDLWEHLRHFLKEIKKVKYFLMTQYILKQGIEYRGDKW